jgi:glycine/betaine/sarcosine/D-proline reductase family selenoprotein B
MPMSRRCIPYTPRHHELCEMTLALVTTAGVHARDQEPFDPDGDNSWRVIPGDIPTSDLMVTHEHYDHQHADADANCVFPLDRLRELATRGVIAGVGDKHLGFMGFSQRIRDLYERAAPEMARVIERSQADAVLLTAGCPLCHRTVVAIAREIEMLGLPTVLITLVPQNSREMGPPRAVAPFGFLLGDCLGPPHQPALQHQVLRDALRRLEAREEPGAIWEISYPDYAPDPAIAHHGEIIVE